MSPRDAIAPVSGAAAPAPAGIALDPRLTAAGMGAPLALLVAVFLDHLVTRRPITESWACCPGCGHEYTEAAPECPTAAAVRPILRHRRAEGVPPEVRKHLITPTRQHDLALAPADLLELIA